MMNLTSVSPQITNLLHSDLDGQFAAKIQAACFTDEAGNQIDFFRLWGRTIRRQYTISNTITSYHFVDGETLDLFNAHYGA